MYFSIMNYNRLSILLLVFGITIVSGCKKEEEPSDDQGGNNNSNPIGFNASQTYTLGPVMNGQYFDFSYSETVYASDFAFGGFSAEISDDNTLDIQFPYWDEEDNQAYYQVFLNDVPNSLGTHSGLTLSHLDGNWVHYSNDLTVTITEISNTVGGKVKGTFSGPCTSALDIGLGGVYETNCNGTFTVPFYE
jgi:hypothetical protein